MCVNDSVSCNRRTFACADCVFAFSPQNRRLHCPLPASIRCPTSAVLRIATHVMLRKIFRRLRCSQFRAGLRQLLMDFRRIDFRQQFALVNLAADVVIPLLQIPVRPRINRRFHVRLQSRGQHHVFGFGSPRSDESTATVGIARVSVSFANALYCERRCNNVKPPPINKITATTITARGTGCCAWVHRTNSASRAILTRRAALPALALDVPSLPGSYVAPQRLVILSCWTAQAVASLPCAFRFSR